MSSECSVDFIHENRDMDPHDVFSPTINLNDNRPEESLEQQDESSLIKCETDVTEDKHSDPNQMKINMGKSEDERHGDFVEPTNARESFRGSLITANEDVSSLKENNIVLTETVQGEDGVCKLDDIDRTDKKRENPISAKHADSEAMDSPGNCGGGDSPRNIAESGSQSHISTRGNHEQQEFTPDDSTRDFESLESIHDRKTDVNSKEGNIFEEVFFEVLSSDKNESLEPPLVNYTDNFNSKGEIYVDNRERLIDSSEVMSSEINETVESSLVKDESLIENGVVNCKEECVFVREKQSLISHDKRTANEESNKFEQGDKVEQNSSEVILQESTVESKEILCSFQQSSSNEEIRSSLRLETDTENARDKSLSRHDSGHEPEENNGCKKQTEVDQRAISSSEISQNILDEHPIKHNFDNETENELIRLEDKTNSEVQATPFSVLSVTNNEENSPEVQVALDCRLGDAKKQGDPIKIFECDHEVIEHSLLKRNTKVSIMDSIKLRTLEDNFADTNRNTEAGIDNSNHTTNGEKNSRNTSYSIAHDVKIDFSLTEDRTLEVVTDSCEHELNSQVTKSDHETNSSVEDQFKKYNNHSVNVIEKDNAQIGEGSHSESLENMNNHTTISDTFSISENNGLVRSTFKENNNTTKDDHLMDDHQINELDDNRPPTINEVNQDMEDNVPTQDAVNENDLYVQDCISTNMEKHNANQALLESLSELSIGQESSIYSPTSKSSIGSNNVESSTQQENPANQSGPNKNMINRNEDKSAYLCVDIADNEVANAISLLEPSQEKLSKNAFEPMVDTREIEVTSKNFMQISEKQNDLQETTMDDPNQFSLKKEDNCFMKVDKFSEISLQCSRNGSVGSVVVSDKSCSVLASESDSDIEDKASFCSSHHSYEETHNSKPLYSKSLSQIESNCAANAEEKADLGGEESHIRNSRSKMTPSEGNYSTALDTSDQNTLNQELISLDKYSEHYSKQITLNDGYNTIASEEESSEDISMNTIIEDTTVCSESQARNEEDIPTSKIENTEDKENPNEVNLNDGVELELTNNEVHSLTNTTSCLSENKQISIHNGSEAINASKDVIVEETSENLRENMVPSMTSDCAQRETNDQEMPNAHPDQDPDGACADDQIIESFIEELERKENCISDTPQPRVDENALDNGDQNDTLLECDTLVEKTPVPDSWGLNSNKMKSCTINKKIENNPRNERIKSKTNPTLINGATQTDELAHVFQQIRAKRSRPPIIIVHLDDAKSLNGRLETAEEKEINSLEYVSERQTSFGNKEDVAKDATLSNRPIERIKPSSSQGRERISTIHEVPDLMTNLPLKPVKFGGNIRAPNGMQNRSGQFLRQRTQTPSSRVNPSVIPTIISPVSIIRRHFKGNTVSPRVTPRGDHSTQGTVRHGTSPSTSPTNQDIPTISCPMSIKSPSKSTAKANATTPAETDACLHMARGGVSRRRLQFGPLAESRNTPLCGLVPLRSPRTSLEPTSQVACRNQNKFPKDWYPGYRFYIAKPSS